LEKNNINNKFISLEEFYELKKDIESKIEIYNTKNEEQIKILYKERLEDITLSIENLEKDIASSNDRKRMILIKDIISGKKKSPKITKQNYKKILEEVSEIIEMHTEYNMQEELQKSLESHLDYIDSIKELLLFDDENEMFINYINTLSSHELIEKAGNIFENFQTHIHTSVYERNPYIAEIAKRRAKGVCQLCKNPSPFNDKQGRPYLEEHHIIWLSKGGQDSMNNVVALCPNCHAKMHNSFVDELTIDELNEKAQEKFK